MEKMKEKIEGWKESILNQAGKEVLIKAVIQAIPTYAMSILRFPKSFCNNLNAKVAKFWWRKERGVHWKAWPRRRDQGTCSAIMRLDKSSVVWFLVTLHHLEGKRKINRGLAPTDVQEC
ncbi:hypothetical protein AHAS_Ahas19G0086400 [Arachis hypogaea]